MLEAHERLDHTLVITATKRTPSAPSSPPETTGASPVFDI
jgi:hypothetical protein